MKFKARTVFAVLIVVSMLCVITTMAFASNEIDDPADAWVETGEEPAEIEEPAEQAEPEQIEEFDEPADTEPGDEAQDIVGIFAAMEACQRQATMDGSSFISLRSVSRL